MLLLHLEFYSIDSEPSKLWLVEELTLQAGNAAPNHQRILYQECIARAHLEIEPYIAFLAFSGSRYSLKGFLRRSMLIAFPGAPASIRGLEAKRAPNALIAGLDMVAREVVVRDGFSELEI